MALKEKKYSHPLSKRFPTVRCTEHELSTLTSRAQEQGETLSTFVRRQVFQTRAKHKASPSNFDFSLIHELNKIGVNLNQLTKVANATGEIPFGIERLNLKIEQLLDLLLAQISNDHGA